MDSIIHLVRNMQAGEIKLLRHFQKLQQNNDTKKDQLFETALKWKNCEHVSGLETKILQKIYGKRTGVKKNFEKLKLRLKGDILNILLLNDSSVKKRSKHESAVSECRRFILQADVLLGRGVYTEGTNLVKKAAHIAQKNELYAELLLIDNLCSSHNIVKYGGKHGLYGSKVKEMVGVMEKSLFAKYFHDELLACSLFKGPIIQPVEEWKEKLERIRKDYQSSGSLKIGFYYNFSALHFYRHINDYKKSLEFGQILNKHSELFDIFQTPSYMGNIHRELAKCYLLVKNYEKAIHHAELSVKHFSSDKLNCLVSFEILYFCYIAMGEYNQAIDITEKAFSNSYLQGNAFMASKWWFFQAGTEFYMKQYQRAISCLKKCNELLKDKSGWMLAFTFFETICRIESGNLEWFEYKLEGMKKLMQRHNNGQEEYHNKRFGIMFRILKTLNKNGYDFQKILLEEQENLTLLSEGDNSYGWYLSGLEPVRFEEWILEKSRTVSKGRNTKLVA